MISGSDFKPFQPVFTSHPLKPSKLISAHTFAYISLDSMIPQEADQTHIEYGFPVVSELCMLHNVVLEWVFENRGHHLTSWNQPFLSSVCLEQYAQAIRRMGSPLPNCFGFVDGTVHPIARPDENQRVVYNGHMRVHALKFQSRVTPNGLTANLCGPFEGRRHDAGMLHDSGLLTALQVHGHTWAGQELCIYGDPAYPLRPQLMCPYREGDYVGPLTPEMRAFNTALSRVRISVVWLFGDITNYFKFIDYKKT